MNINYWDYFSDSVTIDLTEFNKANNIVNDNIQPLTFTLKNYYSILELKDLNSDYAPDIFEDYYIQDGDRPDIISYKLYTDYSFWWVSLLVNHISIMDFPLNKKDLIFMSEDLYKTENKYASSNDYYKILNELNDKKRSIKVVKKEYLSLFLRQLYDFVWRNDVN